MVENQKLVVLWKFSGENNDKVEAVTFNIVIGRDVVGGIFGKY